MVDRNPAGGRATRGAKQVAERWKADGKWKIVLDNGCPACNCDTPGK
jgi:hypothetical protein